MFFDDHPRFLETSSTASYRHRLNARHDAMIGGHRELLAGRRVLDVASHDGRWSLAALHTAGAAHVTGVEAGTELVEHAEENLAHYGVDADRYRFVAADVFEVFADPGRFGVSPGEVDVVMCLGFLYHTLRYSELLNGLRDLGPERVLLDTAVHPGEGKVVRLFGEDTTKQSASANGGLGHGGRMLTGRPTVAALELMLGVHGFEVESRFDWEAFAAARPDDRGTTTYRRGKRVTWVVRPV